MTVCLSRTVLAAGVGEDAGRDAYLAGFHAAQAVILGPDAGVPLDRASEAIDKAAQFTEQIAVLLA